MDNKTDLSLPYPGYEIFSHDLYKISVIATDPTDKGRCITWTFVDGVKEIFQLVEFTDDRPPVNTWLGDFNSEAWQVARYHFQFIHRLGGRVPADAPIEIAFQIDEDSTGVYDALFKGPADEDAWRIEEYRKASAERHVANLSYYQTDGGHVVDVQTDQVWEMENGDLVVESWSDGFHYIKVALADLQRHGDQLWRAYANDDVEVERAYGGRYLNGQRVIPTSLKPSKVTVSDMRDYLDQGLAEIVGWVHWLDENCEVQVISTVFRSDDRAFLYFSTKLDLDSDAYEFLELPFEGRRLSDLNDILLSPRPEPAGEPTPTIPTHTRHTRYVSIAFSNDEEPRVFTSFSGQTLAYLVERFSLLIEEAQAEADADELGAEVFAILCGERGSGIYRSTTMDIVIVARTAS